MKHIWNPRYRPGNECQGAHRFGLISLAGKGMGKDCVDWIERLSSL